MTKYSALTEFLAEKGGYEYNLSFGTIEAAILGFKLPKSAYEHRPWWANSKSGHSQSEAWQSIGWETSNVDLVAQRVTFSKKHFRDKLIDNGNQSELTIEEAKIGLAARFGINPENIEITIKM